MGTTPVDPKALNDLVATGVLQKSNRMGREEVLNPAIERQHLSCDG